MSRVVVAGPRPKVFFDDGERARILEIAADRQRIGAAHRAQFHAYEEGEPEALNRVGHHVSGELTEQAVALWLADRQIRCTRPESLKHELDEGLPDISTDPHGVVLDVKSKIDWPHFLLRCDQTQDDAPNLGILWCKPLRPQAEYENYDTYVPVEAEIWGWVTMSEAKDADNDGEHHSVPRAALRSPSRLLEWIATAVLPQHR